MWRKRCGLPPNGRARMQIGVVVDLDERLQRDAAPLAVVEDRVVVIGNAPRPRIDVVAGIEVTFLRVAAELGVAVAAAQGPVPPTGAAVILEHLYAVAGLAQLIGGDQSGKPG